METSRHIISGLWGIYLTVMFCACSDGEKSPGLLPEQQKITLTLTRDNGQIPGPSDDGLTRYVVPSGPPVVQFWNTSDPSRIGTDASWYANFTFPDGTGESEVDYPIPDANNIFYPADGSALTAVAYAPKELIPENGRLRLRVPDGPPIGPEQPGGAVGDPYLVGHSDIITARAITGSGYVPFKQPLEFKHKQARVTFMAIKANTMRMLVKNVRIRVPYVDQIVEYLQWDAIEQDFMPVAYTSETVPPPGTAAEHFPGEHYFGQMWQGEGKTENDQLATAQKPVPDDTDDFRYIGTVYLMPGRSQVRCSISAHIGDPQYDSEIYGDEKYHRDFEQTIRFLDASGNPITLDAGDSYVVRLIFSDDMISVKVQYPQWQPGGEEPLPIKPGS